ncbi:hypothetical protein WG902_15335 [Ramlibacter sp. PS3R-8]|uniref:hypothetical protein n=1 Tax=Ramlibacter sp. PS3R-8 TaxID=3133437 RepID=UPI0030970BDD
MEPRIHRRDGSVQTLAAFLRGFSASLFQLPLHYAVCGDVARSQEPDASCCKVLHNLLSIKSRVLMGVTAVIDAARHRPGEIVKVELPPAVARALRTRLAELGIEVLALPQDVPLLPRQVAMAFAAKVLLHRLYRVLRRRLVPGVPLVRAWVEVTETMFGDLFDRAQLRVYPFGYGVRRQASFVRALGVRGVRWSFDGVPYRWRDLLAPLWPGPDRHLRLAAAEWRAYDRFAAEVLEAGVREVFTSDEFEVGAVAAGDRLLAAGATYVNAAHGIGLYSPRVSYSEFRYLHEHQASFYRAQGPAMTLTRRASRNASPPFRRGDVEAFEDLVVVHVHQNFEHFDLPSEIAAQQAILAALSELAREPGVTGLVKLHPNMPRSQVEGKLPANLRVISRWDEARGARPVFLTIYSTAFYELAEAAPVLVYAAPTYNPKVYLDGDFDTFTEADLADRVRALRDPSAWGRLVDRQVRSLRDLA